jgi:Winged helix-turn helix
VNRRDRPALEDRRQRRPMLVVQPRRLRWRIDLLPRIFEEFRIVASQQTLGRVLRKMGYRKLSASPAPSRPVSAIEDFKKSLPPAWTERVAPRIALPACRPH